MERRGHGVWSGEKRNGEQEKAFFGASILLYAKGGI
jgi:hypothetical protein